MSYLFLNLKLNAVLLTLPHAVDTIADEHRSRATARLFGVTNLGYFPTRF